MKARPLVALLFAFHLTASAAELQEVASFGDQQVTGVGVSGKSGRVFVNFPNWSDDYTLSVAEVVNGKATPYPNAEWNKTDGAPSERFVCVQSVVVDDQDNLWILDPAAPKMAEIVKGGPKLVKVNLQTNKVVQTIPFGEALAPTKSYLNDVRIDTAANVAFLTDSGKGAIVVVDLKTGKGRRLLEDHPSTQAEDVKLTINGQPLLAGGKTPPINSDGIALDAKNGYLYYHALTGHTLYRIKTSALLDEKLSPSDLAAKVEKVAQTAPPDGMLEGPESAIYLTDLENSAINRWNPASGKVEPVITDPRLIWPDTLAWGPASALYVTASQIQHMPRFNDGKSTRTAPYKLWRVTGL